MRIALVGYGRMGREVEAILADRGHELSLVVDPVFKDAPTADGPPRTERLSAEALAGCDAAIEFSLPAGVVTNVRAYAEAGVPAVVGTTGWLDELDEVRRTVEGADVGLVYGSNFSIGAHLFFRIAEQAAALVADVEEYDLLIHEMHHRGKKDSPSGTAITLAEAVMRAAPRKRRMETARLDRAPEPDELHVSSSRGGWIPGTHTLYLDSLADTIEVRHQARSRGGFALGAVRAAEWIAGRSGLYTVEAFIDELVGGKHV